jgi:hypothetical protein
MQAMTGSSNSSPRSPLLFILGGLVIAAIVAVIVIRSGGPTQGSSASSAGADQASRADQPSRADAAAGAPNADEPTPPAKSKRYNQPIPLDVVATHSVWNPPRPLRFLVTHRGAGSEAAARERAEDVRRRFVAGESAFTLIRQHSEAPRRIPAELIARYESLPPDQASPVIPIEAGFVLFFGTPTSPPDAGPSASADAGSVD